MKLFTLLTFLTAVGSFHLHNSRKITTLKMQNSEQKFNPKALIPGVLAGLFFLNSPDISHALQSGGRSGGSSFRSSPRSSSTRSYSAPTTRSYSRSSGPSINIMPAPMFSPFGYSPFGFSPFGFSPFGFMPINLNFIILAG